VATLAGEPESGGPQLGLDAIAGAQFTPAPQGRAALQAEVRHGYVRGEPHSVSGRVEVVLTL
jgi:hypothetical protein